MENEKKRCYSSRSGTEGKVKMGNQEIRSKEIVPLLNLILNDINDSKIQMKITTNDFKERKILWTKTAYWYGKDVRLIITSKKKLNLPNINIDNIFKTFILTINNFFILKCLAFNQLQNYKVYLNDLYNICMVIIKLYKDNYLTIHHIFYVLKFLLVLSTLSNDFYLSIQKSIIYTIKNINLILTANHMLKQILLKNQSNLEENINQEELNMFIMYVQFIKGKFIDNNIENIYYLSDESYDTHDLFNLIDVLKVIDVDSNKENNEMIIKILSDFYSSIYKFNFSHKKIMGPLLNETKQLLFNIPKKKMNELKKDINVLQFIIEYINKLSQIEKNEYADDFNKLETGFFSIKRNASISTDNFNIDKNVVNIFFGFNFQPDLNINKNTHNNENLPNTTENKDSDNNVYTLLTLLSKKDNKIQFQLSIKQANINKDDTPNVDNNKYYLFINDKNSTEKNTSIIIVPKRTYLFNVELDSSQKSINLNYTTGNIVTIETCRFTPNNSFKKELSCIYGNNCQSNCGFIGYLGTLFIITDNIENKQGKKLNKIHYLFELKGKYEHALYANNFDMRYYTKFNRIIEHEYVNSQKEIKKIQFSLIISPKTFSLIKNEDCYARGKNTAFDNYKKKANYLNIKSNNPFLSTCKIEINCPFDQKFHIFYNKYIISDLLRCEGIDYFCLMFVYISELLSLENIGKDENMINKIYLLLVNIFNLLFKILGEIRLPNFLDEINKLFFEMYNSLNKLFEYRKMSKELFACLNQLLVIIRASITDRQNKQNDEKSEKLIILRNSMFIFLLTERYYNIDNIETLNDLFYTLKKILEFKGDSLYVTNILESIFSFGPVVDKAIKIKINNNDKVETKNVSEIAQLDNMCNNYIDLVKSFLKGALMKYDNQINENLFTKEQLEQEMKGNKKKFNHTLEIEELDKKIKTYQNIKDETSKKFIQLFYDHIQFVKNEPLNLDNNKLVYGFLKIFYLNNYLVFLEKNSLSFLVNLFEDLTNFEEIDENDIKLFTLLLYIRIDVEGILKNKSINRVLQNSQVNMKIIIDLILKYCITNNKEELLYKNFNEIKFDKNITQKKDPELIKLLLNFCVNLINNKNKPRFRIQEKINYYQLLIKYLFNILELYDTNLYYIIFEKDAKVCTNIFIHQISLNMELNNKKDDTNNDDEDDDYGNLKANIENNNLTDIINDKESLIKNNDIIKGDFKLISRNLIHHHKNPFIFEVINYIIKHYKKEYLHILNYLVQILMDVFQEQDYFSSKDNSSKKEKNKKKISNEFLLNCCNFLEILCLITTSKNCIEIFNINQLNQRLVFITTVIYNSELLYSKILYKNYSSESRLLSELYFDCIMSLIIKSKNNFEFYSNYIDSFRVFPKKKSNQIFSIFYVNDDYQSCIKGYELNLDLKNYIENQLFSDNNNDNNNNDKNSKNNKNNNSNKMNQIYITELILVKLHLYLFKMQDDSEIKDANGVIIQFKNKLISELKTLYDKSIIKNKAKSKLHKDIYQIIHKSQNKLKGKNTENIEGLLEQKIRNAFPKESSFYISPSSFSYKELINDENNDDLIEALGNNLNNSMIGMQRNSLKDSSNNLIDEDDDDNDDDEEGLKALGVKKRKSKKKKIRRGSVEYRRDSKLFDNYINENSINSSSNEMVAINSTNKDDKNNNNNNSNNNSNNINQIKEDFESILKMNYKDYIKNPKKEYLCIKFGINFLDVLFENEAFKKMKQYYTSHFQCNCNTKLLNYPSTTKNFCNSLEPPLFLKHDQKFFTHNYFKVSHSYFSPELMSKIKYKEITFNKRLIIDVEKKFGEGIECELVKVSKSIYGKIFKSQEFILFEEYKNPKNNNKNKLNYIFSSVSFDEENYNEKNRTQILIFYDDIKEIIMRRFLFMHKALEIFTNSGKSYFINFYTQDDYQKFIILITPYSNKFSLITNLKEYFHNQKYQHKWNNSELTNYEFLLLLNKFSTRTYNDCNQYPVFPWLLVHYNDLFDGKKKFTKDVKESQDQIVTEAYFEKIKSKKTSSTTRIPSVSVPTKRAISTDANLGLKISTLASYRELKYPISVQTEEKRFHAIKRFNDCKEENVGNKNKFCCGLGSHYSTSSYIYYYLMRSLPFTNCLIKLQNGGQENPNRMFFSLFDTQDVLENSTDNRELIPEFFCKTEFMVNLNCNFFGKKTDKKIVDDLILYDKEINNNRYKNFVKFMLLHKKIINNKEISKTISSWIDFIFGCKQITDKAEDCTRFSKYTYEQKMNLEKKKEIYLSTKDNKKHRNNENEYEFTYRKLMDKINLIINFGMTPYQILDKASETKYETQQKTDNEVFDDDVENYGKYINSINKEITIDGNIVYVTLSEDRKFVYIINERREIFIHLFSKKDDNKKSHNLSCETMKFKFLSKNTINLDSKKFPIYLEKIKYSFIVMKNNTKCITCKYLDNTFKIHQFYGVKDKKEINPNISVYANDFIHSIAKINESLFITGSRNGKLNKWFINNNNECLVLLSIYGHEGTIYTIDINHKLNILATGGSDHYIFIRKIYDFELLTCIKIKNTQRVLNCLISDTNLIYIFCYDYDNNRMIIYGYTLNGIKFAQSDYGDYTNLSITMSGNIIAFDYINNRFIVLNGYDLKFKEIIKLVPKFKSVEWFDYFYDIKTFIISNGKSYRYFEIGNENDKKVFE